MQRGLIIAIFSILAIIIGLAAAIKLSSIVAMYLGDSVNISARWLPFISFIIVFLLVAWLVRLGANILSKTVEMAFLGWVNRLAGVILYLLLYTLVFSIVLFYAVQLQLVKEETVLESNVYPWVEPMGPYVINGIGKIVPLFQDMFKNLQSFFGQIPGQLP